MSPTQYEAEEKTRPRLPGWEPGEASPSVELLGWAPRALEAAASAEGPSNPERATAAAAAAEYGDECGTPEYNDDCGTPEELERLLLGEAPETSGPAAATEASEQKGSPAAVAAEVGVCCSEEGLGLLTVAPSVSGSVTSVIDDERLSGTVSPGKAAVEAVRRLRLLPAVNPPPATPAAPNHKEGPKEGGGVLQPGTGGSIWIVRVVCGGAGSPQHVEAAASSTAAAMASASSTSESPPEPAAAAAVACCAVHSAARDAARRAMRQASACASSSTLRSPSCEQSCIMSSAWAPIE